MNCDLTGARIRVFGRALHAIARVSNEFWFDPVEKGLYLRAVNSSRSAYACVFFSSKFFQHYSCQNTSQVGLKKKHAQLTCRLVIKAVLPVFRCLNKMERNIEKFNIYSDIHDSRIVFQLFCRHGLVKTHHLAFQECDPLQAVFAKHLCPNVLKVQSRHLSEVLIHFASNQDEITLAVTPMKVCFKSYIEEEIEFVMNTKIHLSAEEFEYFQVGIDSEVTFCLKELRGFVAFAEAISTPVCIYFDVPGKPIGFGIEDLVLEATFVLATLADTESKTVAHQSLSHVQGLRRSTSSESSSRGPAVPGQNTKDGPTTPTELFAGKEKLVQCDPGMAKFHSLFFGAISSAEQGTVDTFNSLATASDTEEDYGPGQLSPTV